MELAGSSLCAPPLLLLVLLLCPLCRPSLAAAQAAGSGSLASTTAAAAGGAAADRLALLDFKSMVSDPLGALTSWNDSTPLCRWRGVTCGGRPPGRVTEIALNDLRLGGIISPRLADVAFLANISLPGNQLRGGIPAEFGRVTRLQRLNLSFNALDGEIPPALAAACSDLRSLSLKQNGLQGRIPASLGNCSQLEIISLGSNRLRGEIPPELGSLPKLLHLNLSSNELTGAIPSSLGNLSALRYLYLARNGLRGSMPPELGSLRMLEDLFLNNNALTGVIPPQLGNLTNLYNLYLYENRLQGSIPGELGGGGLSNLEHFDVYVNSLSGNIPASLYNLSYLITLQVGYNQLSGLLPGDLGDRLPSIRNIHLFNNRFGGPIPSSLTNATSLEVVELSDNGFTGRIPSDWGALRSLTRLVLSNNSLEAEDWRFVASLSGCRNLQTLELNGNKLGGVLPASLVNLSTQLHSLRLEGNRISGTIPVDIYKLSGLTRLSLSRNLLNGSIPAAVGDLRDLQSLELAENRFSGGIPSSLGRLSGLATMSLSGNELGGEIPASLGDCRSLLSLNLSRNNLNGGIPVQVLGISSLANYLDVSRNRLDGILPSQIGNLRNLNKLDVSENRFAGAIPDAIGSCEVLQYLHIGGNLFEGVVPPALSRLKGLQELDLSRNRLSGSIPAFLADLNLSRLNLSYNDFEGEAPSRGVFRNATLVSVVGNGKLCGGSPEFRLQACRGERKDSGKLKMIVAVVCAALFLVLLASLLVFCHLRKKFRSTLAPSECRGNDLAGVSYAVLHKSTDGFSSSRLIGSGSSGSVYRGRNLGRDEDCDVAVKVLDLMQLGASASFLTECEALGNIRHRNLLKIVTSCSSVDFEGNEFKAIVYEFMSNGSLEEWLHRGGHRHGKRRKLSFAQRLNIAIDVASAVDYLHHYAHIPVIHSDLKPSNVLLDEHLTARVGDFGIARFMSSEVSGYATCSIGVRGTIGYVAPEFWMVGRVSTGIDVYSFGILLLEMMTGRRPTDPIFQDGLTLHSYVQNAMPERATDVVDPELLQAEEEEEAAAGPVNTAESLVLVLRVGLECCKGSPKDRADMRDVAKALVRIRDSFLGAIQPLGRDKPKALLQDFMEGTGSSR